MIEFSDSDLLSIGTQAIVIPVNCVGVMGKGLALQSKLRFSDNFLAYEAACRQKKVRPGQVFVFQRSSPSHPKFILNFPTKRHWREPSRIDDIRLGLEDLALQIRELRIESIGVPALGCGLGGLEWSAVKPMLEERLGSVDSRVILFPPRASSSRGAGGGSLP